MDWLIVGLGNPGPKYEGTRHSIGREVVRALAGALRIELATSKFNAVYGSGRAGDARVVLALPLTYMNDSGRAVAPLARFFQVPPERVLAIYDDMDLPVGVIRIKPEGGSGGNRGAASVIRALGTEAFPRIRIGVGRPPPNWESADYVLSRVPPAERTDLDRAVERAVQAAAAIAGSGVAAAMNDFN